MFKFIRIEEDDYKVSINGINGEESRAYIWNFRSDRHRVYIYDDILRKEVLDVELEKIFKYCFFIGMDSKVDSGLSCHRGIDLKIEEDEKTGVIEATYEINLEFEEWDESFSILSFGNELSELPELQSHENIEYYRSDEDFVSNGFGFRFKNLNPSTSISMFLNETSELVTSLISTAKKNLKNKGNKVLIELKLEPEVRSPCEQYLMYFSQFLEDLGIQAKSEITHHNELTFFSVIPDNKEHALSVIADCLASYLSLPTELEVHKNIVVPQDVALMQLEANIMHLRSQLMLANSIIEAKDTSIHNLKLTNEQYKMSIPVNNCPKQESLVGDLVKVKEYQGKLISIDTPQILRNLKRILRRK
ncbi:hypothetical protein [Shewanella sp. WPAGA9]|uniref:hypothetical protein n=1 Tax=Shewanella sp. ENK2 TaxID=2775245 RepID=UPI00178506B6|nr:hypothetical protein [Shewanella sp. WPAGA9]